MSVTNFSSHFANRHQRAKQPSFLYKIPIEILISILRCVYDSIIIRDKSEFLALSLVNKTFYQLVYEIFLKDIYLAGKDSLELFDQFLQNLPQDDGRKNKVRDLGLWSGDFDKLVSLMGQLPELKTLSICNTSLVKGFGSEGKGLDLAPKVGFPKLQEISLSGIAGGAYARGNLPTLPRSLLFVQYTFHLRSLSLSYVCLPKIDDFPTVQELSLFCVDGPKEAYLYNFSKSSKSLKRLTISHSLRDANLQEFLELFKENLLHLQLDINDCRTTWETVVSSFDKLISLDLLNLEQLPSSSFQALPTSLQFLSLQFRFFYQDPHFRLSQRLVVSHAGAKKCWDILLHHIWKGGLPNLKYFREVGMAAVLDEIVGLRKDVLDVCKGREIEFSNIRDDGWDVLLESALKGEETKLALENSSKEGVSLIGVSTRGRSRFCGRL